MTEKDIANIIKVICPNDEDFEKPIISPAYLKKELEALALEQEPCTDAVSRQAVIDLCKSMVESFDLVDVAYEVKRLPSVSPTRPTGEWKENTDNSRTWDKVRFYCSECGEWQTYGKTGFCPNCGAEMAESED